MQIQIYISHLCLYLFEQGLYLLIALYCLWVCNIRIGHLTSTCTPHVHCQYSRHGLVNILWHGINYYTRCLFSLVLTQMATTTQTPSQQRLTFYEDLYLKPRSKSPATLCNRRAFRDAAVKFPNSKKQSLSRWVLN